MLLLGTRVAAAMRPHAPRLPWPRGVWSRPVEAGALAWVRHVTARSADAEEMRADLAALGLVAG